MVQRLERVVALTLRQARLLQHHHTPHMIAVTVVRVLAAHSALEILAGLEDLNARWIKNHLAPLRIGIGLHTGEVVTGIVGTGERRKFDVTGDTVNTGSRVEGLNKEFGTAILATRETVAALNGAFTLRRCGEVPVKGREKPVEVFEVTAAVGNFA